MADGGKSYFITFDAQGLAEAIDALGRIEGNIKQVAPAQMDKLGNSALRIVKDETPKDSGKLSQSTGKTKRGTYKYEIYQTQKSESRSNPIFYGRAVRMGSRGGYNIVPFKRGALYWTEKKGSIGLERPIPFVGEVPSINPNFSTRKHPGIKKPYNYVDESVKRLQPEIQAISRMLASQVAQGVYQRFRTKGV